MTEQRENKIWIEIALALPHRQELRRCAVPEGTTIERAIELSKLAEIFPELPLDTLQVGIWGKIATRTVKVKEGDRIEFYRPLVLDPRDARRQRAVDGGVMGSGGTRDPV